MEQPLKMYKFLTPTLKWQTGTQDNKTLLIQVIIDDKTFHRRWTFKKKIPGFFLHRHTLKSKFDLYALTKTQSLSQAHLETEHKIIRFPHDQSHKKQAHLYQAHSMDFDIKWWDEVSWQVFFFQT